MARDLFGPQAPCPVCGREIDTKNGRLIYHDHPVGARAICPGSKSEVATDTNKENEQ